MSSDTKTRVLIVDDNESYRKAFRRNLILHGYDVCEAEDSPTALEKTHEFDPQVIVTDLSMRHDTEGLDLIRQTKAISPVLPIIMISAVGTFDEGAEAMRLGATRVISKSKIDEEIESLYTAIDAAAEEHELVRNQLAEIATFSEGEDGPPPDSLEKLNTLLADPNVSDIVKSRAFEVLNSLNQTQPAEDTQVASPEGKLLEKANEALIEQLPGFEAFDADTQENLRTAEFLFQQSEGPDARVDFSRSMGFAYCFAVENEAKVRLRKKLNRFFGDKKTPALIEDMLSKNGRSISVLFQQHLLRAQQGHDMEVSMDNFHFTFARINQHRGRYKPDGLKALGIVLICFGRSYEFPGLKSKIKVQNPLNLRGLESDDQVMKLASLLINLQHYRNPYIHPEISEMTKLSKIRETAFDCLNILDQIQ